MDMTLTFNFKVVATSSNLCCNLYTKSNKQVLNINTFCQKLQDHSADLGNALLFELHKKSLCKILTPCSKNERGSHIMNCR